MQIIFSPNMLKTYQTCPKKYFYKYVQHINIPILTSPFEKGKKIHALANYYLNKVNISRIEKSLNENEQKVWQTLLENPFFQMNFYKSEYQISSKLGNFWIGGRLDAVVKEGENYYILDYKTGFVPKQPQYDFQTMIYLICLEKILVHFDKLSFVYIDLKDKKNVVIEYNSQLKSEYKNLLKQICKKIENDTMYLCERQNCKLCEYKHICE